jgi:hypothetical protein
MAGVNRGAAAAASGFFRQPCVTALVQRQSGWVPRIGWEDGALRADARWQGRSEDAPA